MSLQRALHWSSALRDMRNDRVRLAPGVLTAKTRTEGLARFRKLSLVTATGAYSRSAIMALAIESAKAHQASTGATWAACMSVGLKGAWLAAKQARPAAAH